MFFTFTLIYIQIYFNLLRVGFAFMTQNIKLLLLTFSLFGSLQRKKKQKKKQTQKTPTTNKPLYLAFNWIKKRVLFNYEEKKNERCVILWICNTF